MGLFNKESKDTACVICGGKTKMLLRATVKEGFVCGDCVAKCSPYLRYGADRTKQSVIEHIEHRKNNAAVYASFTTSDSVTDKIKIDREKRLFCVNIEKKKIPDVFSFDEIVGYELIQDGDILTSGGSGAALVGGLAFGAAGAIVGSNVGKKTSKQTIQKLYFRISLSNPWITYLEIPISTVEIKKGGILYNAAMDTANRVTALLEVIAADQRTQTETHPQASTSSIADELMKLKDLLDAGIITQEDFDKAKAKLIG